MTLYIYDTETNDVVAIAKGKTNEECENKAESYSNEYGFTYSPALGLASGLNNYSVDDIVML